MDTYSNLGLQREPDLVLKKGGKDKREAQWPTYLKKNQLPPGQLPYVFEKSTEAAYTQSHPYESMFMFAGEDMAIDEVTRNNNYMRLIFGGKTSPNDNIHLAYNQTTRQMAEAPMEKDSILGHMNPLSFVPGEEATKESLFDTFAKARQYYKGAVDSDAERALKQRPTHRLIATTLYGKKQQRTNHVRGQAHLINRPLTDKNFQPRENLSSRTYAPDGMGGEVPLDSELVYGSDPRDINVQGEAGKQLAPKIAMESSSWVDQGNYVGREIDRERMNFKDDGNPEFRAMFSQHMKRM